MLLDKPEGGWLVARGDRRATPNAYSPGHHAVRSFEGVVHHYTASGSLTGTAKWLCNLDAKASAHFLIGRDGRILQLAPLTWRTWHAGGKYSKLRRRDGSYFDPRVKQNVNGRTLGIEWVSWGSLEKIENSTGSYGDPVEYVPTVRSRNVPIVDPLEVFTETFETKVGPKSRYWHSFTPKQINAGLFLLSELGKLYPELRDPKNHTGHEHCDPRRKIDPGPMFPWKQLDSFLEQFQALRGE